jgi:hypothetical protein
MLITGLRIAVAFACLLLSGRVGAQEDATSPAQAPAIAIAQTPPATTLPDLLSGRARTAFEPVLSDRITLNATGDRAVWLRVRATLPDDGQQRWLRLERQSVDRARLYLPSAPASIADEIGSDNGEPAAGPAPEAVLLRIPPDVTGPQTMYVELRARGLLYLQPQVLRADEIAARQDASASFDRWVNLLLALVAIFGIVRRLRQPASGTLAITVAALAVGLASLASNGELARVPGGETLLKLGPQVVPALWLFACAPLLWCTRRYAGLDKHSPWLADVLFWGAWIFLALAGAVLAMPPKWLAGAQLGGFAGLALAGAICMFALLADPRQSRWAPIFIWAGLVAAVVAQALIHAQVLPPTLMARRGFELMLALLLLVYLLLPWLREIVRDRAKLKRAVVPELSAEEKIAQAREQLMAGLQSGLANAGEGDMEWIAYRRLLEGLKPVLPQLASAVVAMNYHHEDLLIVEPRTAEARYRMLLQQRGPLLKNLSRSRAPQQVGLDFDGPEGPLERVQLAIIPLPIDKPGWGALVIERDATVEYSEEELDLCAEFAALATTAGDEAAEAIESRRANEFDASGVYKREVIERALRQAHETALLQRRPLAVLRISLGGNPAAMPTLADVVRDELDYGETVGRYADDELLVLLPERNAATARELGERILSSARKAGTPPAIGVSTLAAGERAAAPMLERAGQALAKSRAGGGQVQVVQAT